MKTIEELEGMTQQDLVALVQELQEAVKREKELKCFWYQKSHDLERKYESLVTVIKGVINLV